MPDNTVYTGTSPVTIDLAPGNYIVKATKAGYQDYTSAVLTVNEGQTTSVSIQLVSLPPVQGATLFFTSVPAGAEVWIDRVFKGRTPMNIVVTPGTHYIGFWMYGYNFNINFGQNITVQTGQIIDIAVNMSTKGVTVKPRGTTGSVAIDSSPSGAMIFVDNEQKGTSPVTLDLPIGSHTIKATLSGYADATQTVNIVSGSNPAVNLTMEIIPPPPSNAPVSVSLICSQGLDVTIDGVVVGTGIKVDIVSK